MKIRHRLRRFKARHRALTPLRLRMKLALAWNSAAVSILEEVGTWSPAAVRKISFGDSHLWAVFVPPPI